MVINQQGQITLSHGKAGTSEDKPVRREKLVADFSKNETHSKNPVPPAAKKQPISRERKDKVDESKRDEQEMTKNTPIAHRMQRKEEEAIGKTDGKNTFAQRLEEVSDHPSDTLMNMSTFFPFDLFPDQIVIDPVKIEITTKYFFGSQRVQSVLIKDILHTYVEEAPFMATLKITTSDDKDNPVRIAPLKKHDAEKARKIIQGLVIARSEAPDIGKVEAIR